MSTPPESGIDDAAAGTERRAGGRGLTIWALAAAVVFVVLAIGTPLLGLQSFSAADLVMARAPWSAQAPAGFAPQNIYVGDTVDSVIPATNEFAERLHDGDFALWNPYPSGGSQLGSVPDTAVLSPLSLPYLFLPTWLAPGFVKLLELAVGILGMFLYSRRLGLVRSAGLIGGVVFVSSGFMVAWTNWPQTRVAALIPLLFWALERLVQRRRWGDVALTGLVVGAMLAGGFPAVTGYALVAAGVYTVLRLVTIDRKAPARGVRGGFLALAAVVLGVGLLALQLLPFLDSLQSVAEGSRHQTPNSHSPLLNAVLTFAPWSLGTTNPNEGGPGWFGPGHPVEQMSFLGVTAILLAIVGALAWRRVTTPSGVRAYFVTATALTLALVFVGGPLLGLFQHFPLFATNAIGRTRSVLGFFVAALVAIGFDALVRRAEARVPWSASKTRRTGWVAWVAVASVCLAITVAVTVQHARAYATTRDSRHLGAGSLSWVDHQLTIALLFAAVTCAAIGAARFAPDRWRAVGLATLPVLVVVQALLLVLPYWPRIDRAFFYPETPTHTYLEANVNHDRFVARGTMVPGTNVYYGIRSLGGHAFVADNYSDLVHSACSRCFATPTYLGVPADPDAFNSAVLDRLGVAYEVRGATVPIPGSQRWSGPGDGVMALLPNEPVRVSAPASDTVRGLGVTITEASSDGTLDFTWSSADGASHTARRTFPAGYTGDLTAATPEADTTGMSDLTITATASGPLTIRATGDQPLVGWVEPADDGLELVEAGADVVYRRLDALPRIRWAATATVVPDESAAIDLLKSGTAEGVVLAADGPPAAGLDADVTLLEDSGDGIRVQVNAAGAGYLVVADGLQGRWNATVDGASVPLRVADVGLVAVAVGAGEHTVALSYEVPFSGIGYPISGGALALAIGLLAWDVRRRRGDGDGAAVGTAPDADDSGEAAVLPERALVAP